MNTTVNNCYKSFNKWTFRYFFTKLCAQFKISPNKFFIFIKMDAKDIILNIRKIVRSINLESKRIQKEFGVSIPQLLTLVYLNEQEEFKARQSEIKKYLNLNASTVTGLIYRLEAKGYVAKLPKTGDRRVTYVSITTKGKYIIENSPGLLHTELRDKLENMSPDQFEEVKKASNLLVNVLGAKDVSATPVITEHEPINFQ